MTSSWSFSHSASDSWSPCSIQAFKDLPLHMEYISYRIMAPSRIFKKPKLINFSPQTLVGSWIYSKWVLAQSALGCNAALFLIIRRKVVSMSQGGIMNRGYGGTWFDFESDPWRPWRPWRWLTRAKWPLIRKLGVVSSHSVLVASSS